jgi:hypothetical protein
MLPKAVSSFGSSGFVRAALGLSSHQAALVFVRFKSWARKK